MKIWLYIIVGFIFNFILFKLFPLAGGGVSIGLLLTIPLIALLCITFTIVHYFLRRKRTFIRYFQLFGLFSILTLSYSLFISEPKNSPLDIIIKMISIKRNYDKITINDYFGDDRYWNFEKIVAAKKKFDISDTSYSVIVKNHYMDKTYSIYGIFFIDDKPASTNDKLRIDSVSIDYYKFIDIVEKDTFTFYGNESNIDPPKLKIDDFTNYGTGYLQDLNMKDVSIEKRIKDHNPDNYYFVYKIFYWIL
jgi:hypothetical protein